MTRLPLWQDAKIEARIRAAPKTKIKNVYWTSITVTSSGDNALELCPNIFQYILNIDRVMQRGDSGQIRALDPRQIALGHRHLNRITYKQEQIMCI